jgi:ligand-binding sensor domain-containing protein
VNRVVATTGKDPALFVGGSEGLFVTRDGSTFAHVDAIGAHAITGLAATRHHLWVAASEALYRLPLSGRGIAVQRSFVRPGGSHAIQALAVDENDVAWLATEDRGVVRVGTDGTIHTYDRVAGLPSSWFVGLDPDGAGGVFAASLRHGAVHLTQDGAWSKVDWAPSPWGLGVQHDATRTCIATQEGATCESGAVRVSLGHLPDPRVHAFLPLGTSMLVGTEAGVAVYPL